MDEIVSQIDEGDAERITSSNIYEAQRIIDQQLINKQWIERVSSAPRTGVKRARPPTNVVTTAPANSSSTSSTSSTPSTLRPDQLIPFGDIEPFEGPLVPPDESHTGKKPRYGGKSKKRVRSHKKHI
jgi:hypothetical protein